MRSPVRFLSLSLLALAAAACTTGETPSDDAADSAGSTGAPLGVAPVEATMLVHVYYETDDNLERFARELDLLEHADRREGYVAALVEPEEYERLVAEGFTVEVQQEPTSLLQRMLGTGGFRSIPSFACYRTVEETATSLATLESDYPGLVEVTDIGDSWDKTVAGGPDGYDIQAIVITNESITGPKPPFFLMGAIHARELATAELVTRFAEQMVQDYGTDPDVTWLLDNYELHVVPQVNPDGRKIAEQGYTQRKNRNVDLGACSDPPTSSSQYGVDLNRNSSFGWGGAGTSTNPCNLTYRGTSAASEPEVQALQTYMSSIFADQRGPNITDAAPPDTEGVMISVHSYSELVLYPFSYAATSAPNLEGLRTLGRKFGFHNGYEVCQGPLCLYAASGGTDDWAYGELGVAGFTFEIGTSFFQDCGTFESTIVPDNLAALRDAFKAARRPYLTPSGPDAVGVQVSAASVAAGTAVTLTATGDDTRFNSNGWGTEPTQNVVAARYTIDQPSWSGAPLTAMAASDGTFDTTAEGLTATVDTTGWAPGEYLIMVEARDADGNWGAPSAVFLEVTAGAAGLEVCGSGSDEDSDGDTDCSDADCLGTPACATVEVCTDGIDDDGDGDTDCDDADCEDEPTCAPPPEICGNGLDDDGDTYTDCADTDCAGAPGCSVVIDFTDFETGWGFYNDGGADAARYNYAGTIWGGVTDNSGSASSFFSNAFDLSPYTQLEIDFSYFPYSMEPGEDFFVELYDGSSWQVLANYVSGTDFNNNVIYGETITVDSSSFTFASNAQVRFRNDASTNSDYILVDDVTITVQ
ncbi:MAG: M14 family metallopeptidase [Nannocystaceae bacterium]